MKFAILAEILLFSAENLISKFRGVDFLKSFMSL